MAYRKVDDTSLSSVADAIREKGGTSDTLVFPDGFVSAIEAIKAGGGGGGSSVVTKDVNFYDCDGTLLYSYTLEEAQALTELPALPTREGLTCQGWNYDLATIKSYGRKVNIGATYITDDGTTRIYIKLEDGRTSPMLGVCPNGTVDVDWGDGTTHDTLTGTDTTVVQWTPTHNYASAGEYVIKLTVTGSMGFYGLYSDDQYSGILRYSSGADKRNYVYRNAVQKVEIGNSVTSIGACAFYLCSSLSSIVIPNGVTSIGSDAFDNCSSLSSVVIPNSVTSIETYAFYGCSSLSSVVIPNSVTSIGIRTFFECSSLSSIVIPNSVTSIGSDAFNSCSSLSSVVIPNSVTSIEIRTFFSCSSMAYYDFTFHTSVPTLANTNAFAIISADCQIRVPASLYDEWIAATNWSTYASKIVAV